MPKSEVYTWRLTPAVKHALEARARERGVSLSRLLDEIAREWLQESGAGDDAADQQRLHEQAARCFGTVAGGDPSRSQRVREHVRARLRAKAARRRRAAGS